MANICSFFLFVYDLIDITILYEAD